jgi:hypothetical protein
MRATARAIKGTGILLLAGMMIAGMAGCVGSFGPTPAANAVDMDAAHWNLLYGSGTPSHPAAAQTGWQFDLPAAPGSVQYVLVPFNATEDLTGKTLTITFRMASNKPVYSANVETGESGPPSFHLFIEHLNDDFTNPNYRWWCADGGYTLGGQDNQTITLSCPLTYTSWSSVYNLVDQAKFTETLNHLGEVGVTFGGTGGWGHGVNLLGGSAQFQVLDASIVTSSAPTIGAQ